MEEYIVSARKYRPHNFESVVGQNSIAQTLKNSIKIQHLAQAYLFCGPRGVGKTTCARIFAKTINCSNLSDDFEACDQCESCVAFNNYRSLNIHELDAASNNSVDDIRSIIDQVRIPPQIGSYSVYIIDEVHMLSSAAFNAFLKTLEEPPKHVIFILATTEKHKILPTILSRCQIFDFNRISVEDIRERLEFVAARESIDAEHDALHIIAQKADGAMRDALSIFDQIVSFSGKTVTYESTITNLNVLDYEVYFNITDSFLVGNYNEALVIFDNILKKGFEANYFINGLASHFRDILICKDPGTIELLEVGNKVKTMYMQHSQKCSVNFLFGALNIANQCDLNYKSSQNKRLLVEICLLNICNLSEPINSKQAEEINPKEEIKQESQIKIIEPPKENVKVENEPKEYVVANEKTTLTSQDTPQVNKLKGFGISLKEMAEETSAIRKQSEEIEAQAQAIKKINYGNENVSKDQFVSAWKVYAETKSSNPRLINFLNSNIPEPKENEQNKFFLLVEKEQIKNALDKMLEETLHFLKTNLKCNTLELEYNVNYKAMKSSFKSDEEKFNDMANANPEIVNLRKSLNLDFE